MTLQLAEPYAPDPDLLDDYRCFAFSLPLDAPAIITGYEFLPDVLAMAHHAILYLVDGELASEIDERDGADGRPGWQCYGSTGLSEGGSIIATWTPGTFGIDFPDGTGYLIDPGTDYRLANALQPVVDAAAGCRRVSTCNWKAATLTWTNCGPSP